MRGRAARCSGLMLGPHGVAHDLQKFPDTSLCTSYEANCREHSFKKQISGRYSDWLAALEFREFIPTPIYSVLGSVLGPVYLLTLEKWRAKDWLQCPAKLGASLGWEHRPSAREEDGSRALPPCSSRQQNGPERAVEPSRPGLESSVCHSLLISFR